MAKQTINIGSSANDGSGSTIRAGGDLINDNFNEIYTKLGNGTALSDLTFPTGTDTIVGRATTDTLTNKTLTTPTIASITNGGTVTIPSGADTLVARTSTDTLTTKTIDLGNNTITGSLTEFNTALQGDSFVSLTGNETLTNKVLTAPTITGATITGSSLGTVSDLSMSSYAVFNNNPLLGANYTGDTHEAQTDIDITVVTKTSNHPYHGSGSANAYLNNLVESPFFKVKKGTYRFKQEGNTNTGHPLRFYLDSGKTTAYTTNVTTARTPGSSGAYTQIVIDENTPKVLHYQCSSHSLMGAELHNTSHKNSSTKVHTANGSTTTFAMDGASIDTNVMVFVDGLLKLETTDYTISGTNVVFGSAPSNSAKIVIKEL